MKRKLIALLITLQVFLSAFVPIFPSLTTSATEGDSSTTTVQTESTTTSIFPDSKLTWVSYRDYLLQQATNAWNDPEMYVGYEIQFLSCWDSTPIRSGFDADSVENYVLLAFGEEQLLADNVIIVDQAKLVIDGYHYDEDTKDLWYKVKAQEGCELPEILAECPYILYVNCGDLEGGGFDYNPPTFNIGPLKGIFRSSGTVNFKKQSVVASAVSEVSISNLPAIFDITPAFYYGGSYGDIVWGDYDVGTIASEYTDYRYVSVDDIIIIPADATIAYDTLIKTEDTYDYYACFGEIPKGVLALFSDKHRAQLDVYIEHLISLEQVVKETTVNVGGIDVPISVTGKLPEGVTLHASTVTTDTVISEGFKLKDPADLIAALDIKLLYDADGSEWQPKEGRRITVAIGVSALGYEDGTVLRLQHKHGETIDDYDVDVVINGVLAVCTSGFSIYVVTSNTSTNTNGTRVDDNGTIDLEVGQKAIYYFSSSTTLNIGTWNVIDPDGAIHYTVHSQSDIGSGGMYVRWITIVALKEVTGVKLSFTGRGNGNGWWGGGNTEVTENFTINVVTPKAKADEYNGRKLYIIDDVNTSGNITAALVDTYGNQLSLEGAAFSWKREDDVNGEYFINPETFSDDYRSVNIALDHGGLVESRKYEDGSGFAPTTYTVTAILADGTSIPASYTVYYQSEIINSDFEFPESSSSSNYFFYPNGWPELYWKTTAPGQGENISKDVEYGYTQSGGSTSYGPPAAASGDQFAEINAEEVGVLYQDIITVPGEEINWNFSHAPRQNQSWGSFTNAMFIIIGPTEIAQALSQDEIEALGEAAHESAERNNNDAFEQGLSHEEVIYNGVPYYVWYHNAGEVQEGQNDAYNNNNGWTELSGTYLVPGGQYRTRLFFVSENQGSGYASNGGNLIDAAKGGQYKKYLIEYYVGSVIHNADGSHDMKVEHQEGYDQEGLALIYASVPISSLEYFVKEQHVYLQEIQVNGNNYPYNVSYAGDQGSLYIQKYPTSEAFQAEKDAPGSKYADYDIVMRIYLRSVVISVQTEIEFPAAMTTEQKLTIIQDQVTENGGYKSYVTVESVDSGSYNYHAEDNVLITHCDPAGEYTGFFSVHEMPEINHTYRAVQTNITDLPGLYLLRSEVVAKIFVRGELTKTIVGDADSVEFELNSTSTYDNVFADVIIRNVYAERTTTITYKAIGNGKVAFIGSGGVFQDAPTEDLAFYSGKAIGAEIYAAPGATFMGWYKDEACTQPITAADGVEDANHNFKPNANIISSDAITFYAKFETGSIEIHRSNANPGEIFVYHVRSSDGAVDMYVTLECGADGTGIAIILEVPLGKSYTVTECTDWNWRHPTASKQQTNSDTQRKLTFTFDSAINNDDWINGYGTPEQNVY